MASKMNIAGTTSGDNIQLDNVVLDVFSQEILFEAQANLRFESVAVPKTELGVMPGNTIKCLRYNSLDGDSEIDETEDIETDSMETSVVDITVKEHAKAVKVSEYLLRSSVTDVLGDAAVLLGQHYADRRDSLVRDALLTNTNVIYAGELPDRASLGDDNVFDVESVRAAVEVLATNKAPKFDLDAYVCFIHPHQARYLRKDPAWVNVNLYGSPDNILNGEIGRIEDVRFIQTTKVPFVKEGTQNIWSDGKDSGKDTTIAANNSTDVYLSIILGDYAVGLAESMPVEMRDNGVEDFGRKHSLAYYGIWGSDLIETNHALIVETA